jgi:glycerophosphoryl diester phosphodiesterase
MRLPVGFLTTPIAHRALHDLAAGRPENSRPAVLAAIRAGYGIEIDVQISSDGQAMVFHDDTLDRLTGASGPINARTATDLDAVHLKGGNERIPTLSQICRLVAGQVPILVEIKDQDGQLGSNIGRLEEAVAQVLQSYTGPVAVMSFNPNSVVLMAALLPKVPRGLTTCAFDDPEYDALAPEYRAALRDIAGYRAAQASFISHHARDLASPKVAAVQAIGADVLCWTIRSPDDAACAQKIAANITFEGYRAAIAPTP